MDDDQSELPPPKARRASPRPMEFVWPPDMETTLLRVADSLHARKPVLWGVVEAAIWITTQQPDLVDMVHLPHHIRASSITEADVDLKKIYEAQPTRWPGQPPLLWPAVNALTQACARGGIVMSGRQANIGKSEVVPVSAWIGMEIREGGDAGIVAAPADWHRPGVAWWGGLAVRRDDVEKLQLIEGIREAAVQHQDPDRKKKQTAANISQSRGRALHARIKEWTDSAYPDGAVKPQSDVVAECAKALGLRSLNPRTYRRALGGR